MFTYNHHVFVRVYLSLFRLVIFILPLGRRCPNHANIGTWVPIRSDHIPPTRIWPWPVRSSCRRSAATFRTHLEKLIRRLLSRCFYHSIFGILINRIVCNIQNCNRLQLISTAYCRSWHHLRPIGWYPPFNLILQCSHHFILWSCILLLNSIVLFKNGVNLSSGKVIYFTIVIFRTPRCLAIPNSFVISIWTTMVLELISLLLS